MEVIADYTVDKSGWDVGPWSDEPDAVTFEHSGFRCFVLRAPWLGTLCGYVGVPPIHPLHGFGLREESVVLREIMNTRLEVPGSKRLTELMALLGGNVTACPAFFFRVHGGLTFAGTCESEMRRFLCPELDDGGRAPEPWWFGFDSMHGYDLQPSCAEYYKFLPDVVYRDIHFMAAQCRSLAEQLAKVRS